MKQTTAWQSGVAVLGVVLLVVVCGTSDDALAQPQGFVFRPLAFLGDPAPGGGTFFGVFESNMINNRGDVLFGTNLTSEADAGVFLLRKGVISGGRADRRAPPRAAAFSLAPVSCPPSLSTPRATRASPSCSTSSVSPPA